MGETISGFVDGSNVVSRSQRIYPGSHELQLGPLIPLEQNPAPEDYLVLAFLRKPEEPPVREWGQTPAQIVERLCEVAFAICRQTIATRDLLSKLGHQIPTTPHLEVLDRIVREQSPG